MKRVTRQFFALATAFLIVFSTAFGNAFLVAEASEQQASAAVSALVDDENVKKTETSTEVEKGDDKSTGESNTQETSEKKEVEDVSDDKKENEKTVSEEEKGKSVSDEKKAGDEKESSDNGDDSDVKDTLVVKTSVLAGTVDKDTVVKLSCENEDAEIFYVLGGDGNTGYNEYEKDTEITITESTVLFAYAKLASGDGDAVLGEKVSFDYEVLDKEALLGESKVLTNGEDNELKKCTEIKLADLKSGDVVYIVVDGKTITENEAEGSRNKGKRASTTFEITEENDEKLVKIGEGAVSLTVVKENDYIAFKTSDGKYLSTPDASTQGVGFAEFSGLSKWIIDTSKGALKNNETRVGGNDQYLACNSGGNYTVLGFSSSNKKYEVLSFYSIEGASAALPEEPVGPDLTKGEKITKLEDLTKEGASFVVAFGENNLLMTTTADSTKLKGVAASVKDDHLYVEQSRKNKKLVPTIAKLSINTTENNGEYTISTVVDDKTKYLTTNKTGNALKFVDEADNYSTWSFDNDEEKGTFLIKNVNAKKTADSKEYEQWVECFNNLFTTYNFLKGETGEDAFTFSFYTEPDVVELEEPAITNEITAGSLKDGDTVIMVIDSMALSTTVSGTRLAGVDTVVSEEGVLSGADDKAVVLTVEKTDDYTAFKYTEADGTAKYLSAAFSTNNNRTTLGLGFEGELTDNGKWTLDPQTDGGCFIKNINASVTEKNSNKPVAIEYYGNFTTYTLGNGGDAFLTNFYAAESKEPEEPVGTVAKLLTRELYDGDVIVAYYAASKALMTSELSSGRFKAVTAEPKEDGTIETKDTNALVLTVSKNADGFYTFKTDDGKYLGAEVQVKEKSDGKTSTYCNYILSDTLTEDCVWTQEAADDKNAGNFWMINNHAKNGTYSLAFEYYDSKIAVYGINKTKPEYVFNFYALKEGKKSSADLEYDNETSLTIAQWGGNAHYNEFDECEEYVNGDLYELNDMLDTESRFTAVVNGNEVQPWSEGKSTTTKTISYYMGAKGVADDNDYMQFVTSSLGYANARMSFRLRASNTGAGALQLMYSTDGEEFKNMSKGTYSYKYTAYGKKVTNPDGTETQKTYEKSGDGDISDGIAKTSFAPENYVTFSFDIPASADNSEKLYIRLVPTGGKNAKGDDAPGDAGVIRIDSVMITGNPVISDNTCRVVTATPTSGPVEIGQAVELGCATEGAEIYYKLNKDDDFVKYEADTKIELSELPAAITAYAKKDGLSNSAKVIYQYTQAQVETVKANPNGGAVFQGQFLTLKTKTEGATILYRYRTAEEIAADEKQQTNTPSTEQSSSEDENEDEAGTEGELDESSENEIHDDWKIASGSIALEDLPCQIQVKAVKEGYKDSAVKTLKFTKKLNEKYGIYFGQIHAHTSISDGAGSLEEALKHASTVDNLDYIIITDHSNSIDNEKQSKITENVDKSEKDEWTYAHNLVKEYSTDEFTCAYGYEMTWSNGLGHMNTYNTPGFQSRTQTEYSTYSTALNNYYQALRTVPDSINQFNHPGTTFGDFQDFAYYSEENDALITMIEVGNGEGTIGSAGYFPSYEYYTRALDKGWHVAPTNNQDNHKGKWGDANTARTVVLADVNNEDNIYDAMRNCRIYATEDNDLSIYYTLEGNIMGSVLDKEDVGDHLAIKADITDPTDSEIGKVEVIVNGGQSIENTYVDKNSETVEFTVPAHYSYYYLKITEKDGDIAVTAPVWVGDVEACGINKTYTNTVLPVAGEKLDVNVDFYNNESKTLEINNIEIAVSDVDGNKKDVVNVTGEQAGVTSVASKATATYKTDFVYDKAGQVTYEVTVKATLNGVPKQYTDKLTVSYAVPEMVSDVIIDGTHYGDYVTGNRAGNMSAFTKLCAERNIRATVVTDKITADTLKGSKFLVVSSPAKKADKDYKVSHFEDDFLLAVKDYVNNGGSVIVCGVADYSDTTDCQTATEQNKLLEAIGATIRMGSDEVADDKNNGGQVYRLYPSIFNLESDLFAGIKDGQVYSQYSGCSVDISNATANDVVDAAEWLVKGFDTTYSVDCKDSKGNGYGDAALPNGIKGKKNDNEGNVTFLARQKTKAGGQIIVSGGVFLSDYEVKVEMDNNATLPYANATIVKNLLEGATVELATTSIADARKGQMNDVFAVEGYVTSGTVSKDTTFFDTIYIQDETGGMDIFPYANSGLKLGTKVRIVGYLAQYQGDIELKIMSYKILDDEPKVIEPKPVSTKEAMDYGKFGGQLLKTTGTVTRVELNEDKTVAEFWLKDASGEEAAIFIDGYIRSSKTGTNYVGEYVEVGKEISATGILYMHPEGSGDESVPVFRVRDCNEITLADGTVPAPKQVQGEDQPGGSGSGESGSGSGSGSGSSESGSGSGSGSSSSESGSTSQSGSGSSESGSTSQSGSGSSSSSQSSTGSQESASSSSTASPVAANPNGQSAGTATSGNASGQSSTTGNTNGQSAVAGAGRTDASASTSASGAATSTGTSSSSASASSTGETVATIGDEQVALAETPEEAKTDDDQQAVEKTDDDKTATIDEEETAKSDSASSKSSRAAKAAAAVAVTTGGIALAVFAIRKLLLLLHVIK